MLTLVRNSKQLEIFKLHTIYKRWYSVYVYGDNMLPIPDRYHMLQRGLLYNTIIKIYNVNVGAIFLSIYIHTYIYNIYIHTCIYILYFKQ